jgi:hypothetical protein
MMHTFVEADLIRTLQQLPPRCRTIFALACAERIALAYPCYLRRIGARDDNDPLLSIREILWSDLLGHRAMLADEVDAAVAVCEGLMLDEDNPNWVSEQPPADDAAAATALALQCHINGQSQDAAGAAQRAYDAIVYAAVGPLARLEQLDSAAALPASDELDHQATDLKELRTVAPSDVSQLAGSIRDRARSLRWTGFCEHHR